MIKNKNSMNFFYISFLFRPRVVPQDGGASRTRRPARRSAQRIGTEGREERMRTSPRRTLAQTDRQGQGAGKNQDSAHLLLPSNVTLIVQCLEIMVAYHWLTCHLSCVSLVLIIYKPVFCNNLRFTSNLVCHFSIQSVGRGRLNNESVLLVVWCVLPFQLYVLKQSEGGAKTPIANYFTEHVFSQTWDSGAQVKILGKDFIMPGESAE